jgi:molybdopterin-guanine dinucleotide biosynthesis protein A
MTALERDCDAVLVASCDHPLLTTEIVKLLRNALGDAPAAVPIHQGESVPTLAVYRQSVRAVLDDTIKSHDYSFRRFAERCRATWVPSESLRDSDPDLDCLINVNDPIEYERALRQWNAGRSAGRV